MPRYSYYCPKCDPNIEEPFDIIKPMREASIAELCSTCNTIMERNFHSRGIHCGNKSYGSPIVSEALGIHPDQTAEHREHFPDIEVMPEGQLKFDSYQAHNNYLNKIGWGKNETRRIRKHKI